MVQEIVANPDYLDSRKFLYFQQTRNQDKFVIPNLRPFNAIDFLCSRAMPSNSKSAGYLFYETTKGFHFRSFESLLYTSAGVKRTSKDYVSIYAKQRCRNSKSLVNTNLQSDF